MRYILILLLYTTSTYAQNVDSLNAIRADSMRRADDAWVHSPMNYIDHPIYHMFDFDSSLKGVKVNGSLRVEAITPSFLNFMKEVMDDYDTLQNGVGYVLDNYTWVIMYDTLPPIFMPEYRSPKYVQFPGKTLFLVSPAQTFYYAFSYSKYTGQWMWYIFFLATEKDFQVVDRRYRDAGDKSEWMAHRMLNRLDW